MKEERFNKVSYLIFDILLSGLKFWLLYAMLCIRGNDMKIKEELSFLSG